MDDKKKKEALMNLVLPYFDHLLLSDYAVSDVGGGVALSDDEFDLVANSLPRFIGALHDLVKIKNFVRSDTKYYESPIRNFNLSVLEKFKPFTVENVYIELMRICSESVYGMDDVWEWKEISPVIRFGSIRNFIIDVSRIMKNMTDMYYDFSEAPGRNHSSKIDVDMDDTEIKKSMLNLVTSYFENILLDEKDMTNPSECLSISSRDRGSVYLFFDCVNKLGKLIYYAKTGAAYYEKDYTGYFAGELSIYHDIYSGCYKKFDVENLYIELTRICCGSIYELKDVPAYEWKKISKIINYESVLDFILGISHIMERLTEMYFLFEDYRFKNTQKIVSKLM